MVAMGGFLEWMKFRETGDLEPLLEVLQRGDLAPLVQGMMARELRGKPHGYFTLRPKAPHKRADPERSSRLYRIGSDIADWAKKYRKLEAALAHAQHIGLIKNRAAGLAALKVYREGREAEDDV